MPILTPKPPVWRPLRRDHPAVAGLDIRGFWTFWPTMRNLATPPAGENEPTRTAVNGLTLESERSSPQSGAVLVGRGGASALFAVRGTETVTHPLKPALPVTIICRARVSSGSNAMWASSGSGANYAGVTMIAPTGGVVSVSYGNNGGSGPSHRRTGSGTTNLTAGQWYDVAGVIRGATNMSIYLDGKDDTGSFSGTGTSKVETAVASRVGDYVTGTTTIDGAIDYLMLIAGNVSQGQINHIQGDPYALLEPKPRFRYFDMAAAAPGGGRIWRLAGVGGGLVGQRGSLVAA